MSMSASPPTATCFCLFDGKVVQRNAQEVQLSFEHAPSVFCALSMDLQRCKSLRLLFELTLHFPYPPTSYFHAREVAPNLARGLSVDYSHEYPTRVG